MKSYEQEVLESRKRRVNKDIRNLKESIMESFRGFAYEGKRLDEYENELWEIEQKLKQFNQEEN